MLLWSWVVGCATPPNGSEIEALRREVHALRAEVGAVRADRGATRGIGARESLASGEVARMVEVELERRGLTSLSRLVRVDGNGDVVFTHTNLRVLSGAGSTDAPPNGKGNLVVGYDEVVGPDDKSGSHSLVVGAGHSYGAYGSVVAGFDNAAMAPYTTAVAGHGNLALGPYASVCGGAYGLAQGAAASVVGGYDNQAVGDHSAILGGNGDYAGHPYERRPDGP